MPVLPGEECNWKRHFLYVLRELIGYLESMAVLNDSRFVLSHIDTIVAGCNQFRKGRKPYSKRVVEYALAFLESLGIIARVPVMEWKNPQGHLSDYRGFVIAPHAQCCMLGDGRCTFWCGAVMGLGHNRQGNRRGVRVTRVTVHPRSQDEDSRKLAEIMEKMKNGEVPK
jgi:hypothetical protein